jgi:uncharacterized membrane protein
VTEQVDEVDWDEVERRERRLGLVAFPVLVVVFASFVLLTGRYAFWEGRSAWVAVGGFLGIVLVAQVVAAARGRTGPRARMLRFRYALLHRVDPGPDVRGKVDVAARQMARMGWLWWVFPLTPASLLLGARWERPLTTVPAALLLVGATAWFVVYWRRMTAASRRWVASPPGPDREVPPPTRRERLMSGRGLKWLIIGLLGVVAVGLVVGLVMGFFFSD